MYPPISRLGMDGLGVEAGVIRVEHSLKVVDVVASTIVCSSNYSVPT